MKFFKKSITLLFIISCITSSIASAQETATPEAQDAQEASVTEAIDEENAVPETVETNSSGEELSETATEEITEAAPAPEETAPETASIETDLQFITKTYDGEILEPETESENAFKPGTGFDTEISITAGFLYAGVSLDLGYTYNRITSCLGLKFSLDLDIQTSRFNFVFKPGLLIIHSIFRFTISTGLGVQSLVDVDSESFLFKPAVKFDFLITQNMYLGLGFEFYLATLTDIDETGKEVKGTLYTSFGGELHIGFKFGES